MHADVCCVCVCVCLTSRPSGIIRTNKDNRVSRSAAATALGCIARSTTALRAGGQVLALLVGTVRLSHALNLETVTCCVWCMCINFCACVDVCVCCLCVSRMFATDVSTKLHSLVRDEVASLHTEALHALRMTTDAAGPAFCGASLTRFATDVVCIVSMCERAKILIVSVCAILYVAYSSC